MSSPVNAYPENSFDSKLAASDMGPLRRRPTRILQINLGRVCNQACRHCHVDAGPGRTEAMEAGTSEQVMRLLENSPSVERVELTGGAPELNQNFRNLVRRSRELGKQVVDRTNLTVFSLPGYEDLPRFLADHRVGLVASLPCYTKSNVDKQRGDGVFEASISSLRMLNGLGYGLVEGGLPLDLIYNPLGGFLPGAQTALETDYRKRLLEDWGVRFNRLLTLTNMPIGRFGDWLQTQGQYTQYMSLLVDSFNRETAQSVMCLDLISVAWDGLIYDCDFNQVLALPRKDRDGSRQTAGTLESLEKLEGELVLTGPHCFGCTAGSGSSCGGALAEKG